ncbi:expressed unknown protein [Seminavis robusta]|uniref:Uncharacterized protein n=1 Tax=Seminavis robusta TaxID=568900 RepID=A0A9N8E0H4_9STRA|nr:expressed unknown protein [Seminavis robusta]|eukprot:Sro503_g155710.1 n/a (369) ;mRNA; f:3073-4179
MSCCRFLCTVSVLSLFVVPYVLILVDCSPLLLRLLLQSALLWGAFFSVLYGHTVHTITKRLQTGLTNQRAKILKVRKIPPSPHPANNHKIFCWVQLLDDNGNDVEAFGEEANTIPVPVTSGETQQQQPQQNQKETRPTTVEQAREEFLQDIRAWAHVPCLLVPNDMDPQPGDILHDVVLLEGDLTRPIHAPFQLQMKQNLQFYIFHHVRTCLLALLGLYFFFGTIYLSSFHDFVESTQRAPIVHLFRLLFSSKPDNNDNNNNQHHSHHSSFCRITPGVTVAYDMLIWIQMTIPVLMFGLYMLLINGKKLMGMEEPSPDSYQLLRDDDDFDEDGEDVAANTNNTATSAAEATKTTPYGQYTAVSIGEDE